MMKERKRVFSNLKRKGSTKKKEKLFSKKNLALFISCISLVFSIGYAYRSEKRVDIELEILKNQMDIQNMERYPKFSIECLNDSKSEYKLTNDGGIADYLKFEVIYDFNIYAEEFTGEFAYHINYNWNRDEKVNDNTYSTITKEKQQEVLKKFDEELTNLGYHLKQNSYISRYFKITYLDYQNQQQHIYFNEVKDIIEYSDYANTNFNLNYQNCTTSYYQIPTFTTAMWTSNVADDADLNDHGIERIVNYIDSEVKSIIEFKNKYPYANQNCNQFLAS